MAYVYVIHVHSSLSISAVTVCVRLLLWAADNEVSCDSGCDVFDSAPIHVNKCNEANMRMLAMLYLITEQPSC